MNNRQKILYITTQGEWGGAQRYVYDLAISLSSNHDITVAVGETNGKSDLQNKILSSNSKSSQTINIEPLRFLQRSISPLPDCLAIIEIAKLYKKIKPDVVHLNSSKAGIIGSVAALLTRKNRPKIVYTAHGWVFNEPLSVWRKNTYKILEKTTAKLKDKIIVLSDLDFKTAESLKIPASKLSKIFIGIDQNKQEDKNMVRDKLRQLIDAKNISASDFLLGTIANFYPTKGLPNLLEAIVKVKKIIPNIKAIIIGDGLERKNIENFIEKNNLKENIFLSGFLENASQYVKAFDALVISSNKEGLPYVLLEAICQKVPVISTEVGGIPEFIINKKTGLLVPPNNSNSLFEAIIYGSQNTTELQKMAELSYLQNKQFFDKQKMIDLTYSFYLQK